MHPVEAVLIEVAMHGHGEAVPDPGDRAEGVRSRPQVGDLTQVLERVPLLRDGVALRIVHPPDHDDRVGEELDGLPFALRGGDRAGDGDGAADGQMQDLSVVVAKRCRGHDLEGVEAGPVVNMQKREAGLRIATCPDPALDRRARADRRPAGEDIDDSFCLRHEVLLPASRRTRCRAVMEEASVRRDPFR